MASALPLQPLKKASAQRSFARAVHDCPVVHLHEEYLRACRAEGLRDSTLRMYAGGLRPWERWCDSQGVTSVG